MKFEDLNLPDTPQTRLAFDKVEFDSKLIQMSNPHLTDDGMSPGSMKLLTRVAQIVHETVPTASPEQLAAAMMFLTHGFGQPVLMQRSIGQDMPQVAAWSQEWREVQRGMKHLSQASLELRQIVIAVDTAMMEGYKANVQSLDFFGVQNYMMEADRMALDVGDIKAPDLMTKYTQTRAALGNAINGGGAKPSTGFRPRP